MIKPLFTLGHRLETGCYFNMFPWLYGDNTALMNHTEDCRKKTTILFQNLMKNRNFREYIHRKKLCIYKSIFLNAPGVHEIRESLQEMVGIE